MKIRNKFGFSHSFIARFIFSLIVTTVTLFSFPLFAQGITEVSDVVNTYVYDSDKPDSIRPLYMGDTIPQGGIIYLADVKSKLSFTGKDGKVVVLDKPGFYNLSGEPVQVSEKTRAYVNSLIQYQSGEKYQADNLIREAETDLQFQIDDPQSVVSPVTT